MKHYDWQDWLVIGVGVSIALAGLAFGLLFGGKPA